jgi:ABC-2 type transport system permease protein
MLGKELGAWFQTKRWLRKGLIWLLIINGMIAIVLLSAPTISQQEAAAGNEASADYQDPYALGLSMFFTLGAMVGGIGTIILGQDQIVGEKLSGTAAWILSKPIARQAFVLSKLASNAIGILIFIIAIPGLVAFIEIYLFSSKTIPIGPFLLALALLMLSLLFYLSLSLLLGVQFATRGPILAINLGLLLGGQMLASLLPQIYYLLPVSIPTICQGLVSGMPLPSMAYFQVGATVVWCVVFTSLALWRFKRLEL